MHNFPRNASPYEVMKFMEPHVPYMFEMLKKFNAIFPENSKLEIPFDSASRYSASCGKIVLVIGSDRIGFREVFDTSLAFGIFENNNNITYIDKYICDIAGSSKPDSFVDSVVDYGVSKDGNTLSTKTFISLSLDDDICYIAGQEYEGVEEVLFQMSLVQKDMVDPTEILKLCKYANEYKKLIEPGFSFSAPSPHFQIKVYEDFILKLKEIVL